MGLWTLMITAQEEHIPVACVMCAVWTCSEPFLPQFSRLGVGGGFRVGRESFPTCEAKSFQVLSSQCKAVTQFSSDEWVSNSVHPPGSGTSSWSDRRKTHRSPLHAGFRKPEAKSCRVALGLEPLRQAPWLCADSLGFFQV